MRNKKLPKGVQMRKLKNGKKSYVGRVQVDGRRQTVTSDNLKDLQKAMQKLKYELENGLYQKPVKKERLTLNEWFNIWIKDYKSIRVKKSTLEVYKTYYKNHIKNKFGNMYIDTISVEDVQLFINRLAKSNLKSNTIDLIIITFSNMLKQAYINERIEKNPFNHIVKPKKDEPKKKNLLDLHQEKIFLNYCDNELYKNIFVVALYTGMRVNEILGLTWANVDFNKKLIHVKHTLVYKNKNSYYLSSPKSKTSRRDIPILKNVYDILENLYQHQDANAFVFNKNGTPLQMMSLNSYINKKVQKMQKDGINIKHLTMHSFRHTFATRCIRQGVTPQTLKTILGHSTLSMTMDLYAHVETDTKQSEMEKLEGII